MKDNKDNYKCPKCKKGTMYWNVCNNCGYDMDEEPKGSAFQNYMTEGGKEHGHG